MLETNVFGKSLNTNSNIAGMNELCRIIYTHYI